MSKLTWVIAIVFFIHGIGPVSYTHLRAHETNDLISYAGF